MITVTLYSKPGCHLCEPVEETIRSVAQDRAFTFLKRNILDDPQDEERFRHAIPVVTVNGKEIARYRLSSEQMIRALDAVTK
jgi:hypothetical protein